MLIQLLTRLVTSAGHQGRGRRANVDQGGSNPPSPTFGKLDTEVSSKRTICSMAERRLLTP